MKKQSKKKEITTHFTTLTVGLSHKEVERWHEGDRGSAISNLFSTTELHPVATYRVLAVYKTTMPDGDEIPTFLIAHREQIHEKAATLFRAVEIDGEEV